MVNYREMLKDSSSDSESGSDSAEPAAAAGGSDGDEGSASTAGSGKEDGEEEEEGSGKEFDKRCGRDEDADEDDGFAETLQDDDDDEEAEEEDEDDEDDEEEGVSGGTRRRKGKRKSGGSAKRSRREKGVSRTGKGRRGVRCQVRRCEYVYGTQQKTMFSGFQILLAFAPVRGYREHMTANLVLVSYAVRAAFSTLV